MAGIPDAHEIVPGIWLGNTSRHNWIGTYSATGSSQCFEFYQEGGQSNSYLNINHHCEPGPTVQQEILITGPQQYPTLASLQFREHNTQAGSYFFLEDSYIEYFCSGAYNGEFEAGISPFAQDIDWSICDPILKNKFFELKDSFIATPKDINGLSVKDWLLRHEANNFTI
jgi:hypothetical protein